MESRNNTISPRSKLREWALWLRFLTHDDPELERLVHKVSEFASDFRDKKPGRWITLMGLTGTGKTHIATRLWTHFNARSDWSCPQFMPTAIYWPKLVSGLRSGKGYDRLEDMIRWPVLFLDDIGAERDPNGFSAEQLNLLLNERIGMWTILTSNLSLEQISQMEPRIADRIIRHPNYYIEINTVSHSLRV